MLTVRGLEAAYGMSQVLFGVDLDVSAGQVVTLLGRNGMGKTTTVRAIMGLLPPRRGEVTLDGQPVKDGRVLFTPLDGQGGTGGAAIVEGKFTAEVPVAKMKVEINGNKVIGKRKAYDTPESPLVDEVVEIVPPKYNVNSELTLDVKKGVQEVKYELHRK